eukprot:5523269-Alexandrium_andersonii.AAC.1
MQEAAGTFLSMSSLPCFDGSALWEAVHHIPLSDRRADAVHLRSSESVREALGKFFVKTSVMAWNLIWPNYAP